MIKYGNKTNLIAQVLEKIVFWCCKCRNNKMEGHAFLAEAALVSNRRQLQLEVDFGFLVIFRV